MAKVRFVLGKSGAGKSRMFRHEISQYAKTEKILLIVPEEFTFESERALALALGGGLFGVEVLSVNRLIWRVLQPDMQFLTYLSTQGRRMAVRSAALECEALGPLAAAAKKPGFAKKCEELIARFKQQDISPEALAKAAGSLGGQTGEKLRAIASIYSGVEAFLSGGFLDAEDVMNRMIDRLGEGAYAGARIYVDGAGALSAQMLRALTALMSIAKEISFSICVDPQNPSAPAFTSSWRDFGRLKAAAQSAGFDTETLKLPDENAPWGGARALYPDLAFVEETLFAYTTRRYEQPPEHISLFAAATRQAETERLAKEIQKLAREGMRYRDMGVIVGNMPLYAATLQRVFADEGIPAFIDVKRPLSFYPAAQLLVSAARAATRGFATSDVLALIKTGYTGVPSTGADMFENYVLRYNIRGSMFTKPFERPGFDGVEEARAQLMQPLIKLAAALGANSAADQVRALYDYLLELKLFEQLEAQIDSLRQSAQHALSLELSQVYAAILELLDQLHMLLGPARLGDQFAGILEEGMDGCEIGAIPATADQVQLGELDRVKRRNLDALFVIGCNEGNIPKNHSGDDLIDDAELKALSNVGLTPWPDTLQEMDDERLALYLAFSKPKKRLYVSYALLNGKKVIAKSPLVMTLKDRFALLSEQRGDAVDRSLLGGAQSSMKALTRALRQKLDAGQIDPLYEEVYAWALANEPYRKQLSDIEAALFFTNQPPPLGSALAGQLYAGSGRETSATKLETFNKCAFCHFVRYGLGARERKIYGEFSRDAGALYHEVSELYMKRLIERDEFNITKEQSDWLIDEIIAARLGSHNDGILLESARGRAQTGRIRQVLSDSMWAALKQITAGDFRPISSELEFGTGKQLPPVTLRLKSGEFELTGKIDRVDKLGSEPILRVIDYKSGKDSFRYEDIANGLKLQLPLYLLAALGAGEAAGAGAFYMPLDSPVLKEDTKDIERELQKQFKLNGLVVDDLSVVKAMDRDMQGYSSIVNVRLKKDNSLSGETLLAPDELSFTLELAQRRAGETLENIRQGRLDIRPVKTKYSSACKWCEYGGICAFDPRMPLSGYKNIKRLSRKEFLEQNGMEG